MATLAKLRKRFAKMNMRSLLDEAVKETKPILFDLIRGQIESGQLRNSSLPEYSSEYYSAKKQKMGSKAPYGVTDLKYTGSFLNKLYIRRFIYSIIIRSRDKKNSILLKKHGPDLFLLSDENFNHYVNDILVPLMLSKII